MKPTVSTGDNRERAQFRTKFIVRRQSIKLWLLFLKDNHPGYRDFQWNTRALESLPEDGDVLARVYFQDAPQFETGPESGPIQEPGLDWDPDDCDYGAVLDTAMNQSEREI